MSFETREALQEHYKSEWHRYNLKRKVAGLPPLPKSQFEARREAALAARADAEAKANAHKQDHVKSEKKQSVSDRNAKRREAASRAQQVAQQEAQQAPGSPPMVVADLARDDFPIPPPPPGQGAAQGGAREGLRADGADGVDGMEEGSEEEEEDFEVNLCSSLFEANNLASGEGLAESPEAAVELMALKHGFFLPDIEYLSDLEGLLSYLHQKIGLGHCCLYCNKLHRSVAACRQHMVDKSHCKLAYEQQHEIDELSDFYDFSAANPNPSGNLDGSGGGGDEGGGEEDLEAEIASRAKRVEVLPSGELCVTREDGTRRILGVRWLRRYYAQNASVIDQRESVLSAQREKLRNLYRRLGVDPKSEMMGALVSAGDPAAQSRALSKALAVETQRFTGLELKAAREHFRREHMKSMKLGMSENWNIKNRFRKTRIRAEGMGIHG